MSKLGKVASMVDKGLRYGDDALKAFMTKVKNIPMPIMDEIALAGGGSVKVVGKGTLDDYMKAAKANFSKGSGAVDDVAKKASGAGKKLSVDDLTKELLETKPKNSRDPRKWLDKGGEISVLDDGTWVYTNAKGQSVKYTNGFPDFKKADKLASNGPRDAVNNTWHHHQDLETLQEVDKAIHKEFTHKGGMALKKRK
ncbi:HNH endonuclease [Enterococcus termitis]